MLLTLSLFFSRGWVQSNQAYWLDLLISRIKRLLTTIYLTAYIHSRYIWQGLFSLYLESVYQFKWKSTEPTEDLIGFFFFLKTRLTQTILYGDRFAIHTGLSGFKTEWLKEQRSKYETTTKGKPGGYSASLEFKIH